MVLSSCKAAFAPSAVISTAEACIASARIDQCQLRSNHTLWRPTPALAWPPCGLSKCAPSSPHTTRLRAKEKSGPGQEDENKAKAPKVEGFNLESIADQVLDDEESKAMLRELSKAAERVSQAQAAMAEQERKEAEAAEAKAKLEHLTTFAAQDEAATAMVAAAEEDVSAAEAEVAAARAQLVKLRAGSSFPQEKWSSPGIDEDAERIQSGKAAAISGLVGLVASLPVVLASNGGSLLSLGVTEGAILASCALFGVCYRYIIRRDMGNTQLKLGAVGAFGLVRGMAQVDTTQHLVEFPSAGWDEVLKSALSAGESVIVFGFAAAALDYCLREGYLKPFPSAKPPTNT